MTKTTFEVQGNPEVEQELESDEVFTPEEMAAIQTCADNIDSIVSVATNGPAWTAQGEAAASRAEAAATNAEASNTAAQNAAVSATASASAAATSELNAVNAATAAQADADAAEASAIRAENAAASNENNPALVPSDGNEGDTLYRAPVGAPFYGQWGPALKFLKMLEDVSDVDPVEGQRLGFEGGIWKPVNATAATRFDQLLDTNIVTPVDGQVPVFRGTDNKWHNEAPAAGGGGSTYITRNPDLVGPTSYTIRAIDLNGFRKCNVAAGHVDLVWDDQVAIPAGQRGVGYFKLTGANGTNKVRFNAGSASGSSPGTFGVPIRKGLQSAATNTALTNAENVVQSGTIAQGLKCVLAIVYTWVCSGGTNDDCDSPGFIWNGQTADPEVWQFKNITLGNLMKAAVSYLPLGDIGAGGFPFTWLPQWVDYGGNGRVNAYNCAFIPFYNGNIGDLAMDPVIVQSSGVAAVDPTFNLAAGEISREVCYVVGRRNTTSALGNIALTGCTQSLEGAAGAGQIAGGARMAVGHEAGVANSVNTAHAASTGTGNTPWISVSFAFLPATAQMTLFSRNNKAQELVEPNHMMAWMLDPEQKIVELVY